jgi:hypothetical protein
MCTIEWIRRLITTTWDTYPLIYMGTIVLWLTIICSRKHAPFPSFNKLATSGYKEMKKTLDFKKVFILHTVWSALGIGAILCQLDEEGKEYVITYASRSNKAKSNYFHRRGSVLLLYGSLYFSSPIFMAPSSLCIPTTNLLSG